MLAARLGLTAALDARAAERGPITIGLAGAGQMGTDIVVQVAQMPGLRIGAIAEAFPEAAFAALALTGRDEADVTRAGAPADVDAAIERGGVAVTEDLHSLCAAGRIDVIVDATGNPNVGARLALDAFAHGKPVVMLNVEADITIGRLLRAEAAKAGVVCTGAAGDEPACVLELIAFAQSLGLEIVCAGKGKNNPLKFDAMPEDYAAEAQARGMNPRMLVEFVDGSKTMIEMTAVAQATGLLPDRPGMHGPAASRDALAATLCTIADGGVLSGPGRVDYSIGKGVAPGVFVVVRPRHPRIAERLTDLKVGPGPCYALMRPYHLTSIEVPLSAARAVLTGRPDMEPIDRPTAECACVAKRDLAPGERLGKIGERDYRARAVTWEDLRRRRAVPLGLAEGARVTRPVRAGDMLTYDDCAPDDGLLVTRMRWKLDALDDARFGASGAEARR
jgi:predicted homoserine dehydrogenase-like protein